MGQNMKEMEEKVELSELMPLVKSSEVASPI